MGWSPPPAIQKRKAQAIKYQPVCFYRVVQTVQWTNGMEHWTGLLEWDFFFIPTFISH